MKVLTLGLACAAMISLAALAPAGAAETIKIGIGPVTGVGPVFLAQDRGYFAAENLDADAISFDAAQQVAQGVVSGALDFGTTAATAAAYNLAAKGGLKIIAGQGREVPTFHGSAFLASNQAWNAGLKSLKDMEHHAIGIVQVGGPIHYEFELAVAKYHLNDKTMRIVPLQTLPNTATAIAGGQVDVGINVNTFALKLSQSGQAHLLAWVGDETPWQNTIILVSTKTDQQKPELIKAFLAAYKKGARDYYNAFTTPDGKRKDGPTAPEVLAILAKHLHQPVAQLDQGISYDDPEARLDVKDVMRQVAYFKKQGMLPADADGEAMLDKRFVVPLGEK
ncbi:MAG TPA: ABC transporter substrate-binding protein [Stellaceae bacterium]|jgi:NitT/TauT family transport system substrate-binding protein|nr:ABC transporter substrate-binding protein [Stellaceae bacterium]